MRDHRQNQMFTVFGGSYVTEQHGSNQLPRREHGNRSTAKVAAVAGLLILGITTATAMKARSPDGFWGHRSSASLIVAGIEDAFY